MVVYDVTNAQSFQSCAKWLERVKAKKSAPELMLPGVSHSYNRPCNLVIIKVVLGSGRMRLQSVSKWNII